MGYKDITLKLPTDYTEAELKEKIRKKLRIYEFSYQIKRKSLDARRKTIIHWQIQALVSSRHINGTAPVGPPSLNIIYKKRREKVLVVGSGPAGFFCALILQKSGFHTTLIERGSDIKTRAKGIAEFESTGVFSPLNNYAFGEGGAGTFSDGKLTSRSKHILRERDFIISSYINAGAPQEIRYLAYPHLGSDNLKKLTKRLREDFINIGGSVIFETTLQGLKIDKGVVVEAITSKGPIEADIFVIAPGHSAYDTYRMLMKREVKFHTKNFAIGSRVEHTQEVINKAQWSKESLPGLKAAEYRLTSNADGQTGVYTFCMCPGGTIIPATAFNNTNIVNGMSLYKRDGKFANAACLAGVNLEKMLGREVSPLEALDWVEKLERSFYEFSDSFKGPFCTIKDFIDKREVSGAVESSYPLGLKPAPLWDLLPQEVSKPIREGLKDFCRRIEGFDTGIIMGLESKSSSPIQVIRDKSGLCEGFNNLYLAGEGSGYSGGIISSGADGIKSAIAIADIYGV
ncbi:NAD(P)/FAD-dependent oxidoreductase [Candidatus Omnitrophota bacterium]